MKKAALFTTILALALAARAESVNFASFPAVSSPTMLPSSYSNLEWSGFYYVDAIWNGAGIGFKQGPNALDIAYMGGGECEKAGVSCSASISSNASAANALGGFKAESAIVAAGYHAETINVSAYNHGRFVGSQNYDLSTSLQQINFPANWGMISQLVVDTNSGTLVLYDLNLQSVGATVHGAVTSAGAETSAPRSGVPPTVPLYPIDPPPPAKESVGANVFGSTASRNAAPLAIGLESVIADKGVIEPPIIVIRPTPTKPSPVAHESESTIADKGVVEPPIIVIRPTPTKPSPVAHEAESTIADKGVVEPPIIVIRPTPTKPSPVAHESESVIANKGVIEPPIIVIRPTPTKPSPVAHEAESVNV